MSHLLRLALVCILVPSSAYTATTPSASAIKRRNEPIGIINAGWTCYMAALFQALLVTPFFSTIEQMPDVCKSDEYYIILLLSKFYLDYLKSTETHMSIKDLYYFFLLRLGELDENDVPPSQRSLTPEKKREKMQEAAKQRQKNFEDPSQADASELLDHISGWMSQGTKCLVKQNNILNIVDTISSTGAADTVKKDVMKELSVAGDPNTRTIDVERYINTYFTQKEPIERSGRTDANKSLRIEKPLPDYFIVLNKLRIIDATLTEYKVETCIVPEWLDLAPYFYDKNMREEADYRLVSLVMHLGGTEVGHYIAYVRYGATWYDCNDSKVTPLKPLFSATQKTHTFRGTLPSMLFYVKERRSAQEKASESLLNLNQQLSLLSIISGKK